MCVDVEPKVITKVIEIDETAPTGPAMYPPYWPPVPGAGKLPQLQAGADLEKDDEEETADEEQPVERRKRERTGAGSPAKVFEDNMMDYVREKPEKDEDEQDDDRKRKKKRKQKRKRQKKKKKKPKRQRQKRQKQKRKQRKRRQRRKKRQQKRKQ